MHALCQDPVLFAGADEGRHGVFDFPVGLDYRLPIRDQRLLQPRILYADVVADSAVIQERPDELRADGIADAV